MYKILLIDKPEGWTSFDVVAKIRSTVSKKEGHRIKVGHAGTLDPFATGLLIVLIGDATKKQDEFMKLDKEYEATLKLGFSSNTGDPEGTITEISHKIPTLGEIERVIKHFIGEIEQTPPQFSAIKIKGKPAYKYARMGELVEIKPRKIKIFKILVSSYKYPFLELTINCGSGTYIRTLAEDLGKSLGTSAYLTSLRRTKIGDYKITDAKSIESITNLT